MSLDENIKIAFREAVKVPDLEADNKRLTDEVERLTKLIPEPDPFAGGVLHSPGHSFDEFNQG